MKGIPPIPPIFFFSTFLLVLLFLHWYDIPECIITYCKQLHCSKRRFILSNPLGCSCLVFWVRGMNVIACEWVNKASPQSLLVYMIWYNLRTCLLKNGSASGFTRYFCQNKTIQIQRARTSNATTVVFNHRSSDGHSSTMFYDIL